jgi:hypothetical protein
MQTVAGMRSVSIDGLSDVQAKMEMERVQAAQRSIQAGNVIEQQPQLMHTHHVGRAADVGADDEYLQVGNAVINAIGETAFTTQQGVSGGVQQELDYPQQRFDMPGNQGGVEPDDDYPTQRTDGDEEDDVYGGSSVDDYNQSTATKVCGDRFRSKNCCA